MVAAVGLLFGVVALWPLLLLVPSFELRSFREGSDSTTTTEMVVESYEDDDDEEVVLEIRTVLVPVDHFSAKDGRTFELRYHVDDAEWDPAEGPAIFQAGSESTLTVDDDNDLSHYLAKELKGLVIYAEHRYYGKSMPFGNASHDEENLRYLTTSQAIADYADVVAEVLRDRTGGAGGRRRVPVIAVGGSYGGILAAMMRIEYPHLIAGVIASSAPLKQSGVRCEEFYEVMTSVYAKSNANCSKNIEKSWQILRSVADSPATGMEWLRREFDTCDDDIDFESFLSWLVTVYEESAMYNYPYPLVFVANPVHEICKRLADASLDGESLLRAIRSAVDAVALVDAATDGDAAGRRRECRGPGAWPASDASTDADEASWSHQWCAELRFAICASGAFAGAADAVDDRCGGDDDGERPRRRRRRLVDARRLSNAILSNGADDPWRPYGVGVGDVAAARRVRAVLVPGGAHCSDMRGPTDGEAPALAARARPAYVRDARRWAREFAARERSYSVHVHKSVVPR